MVHTFIVYVADHPGVLNRVSSLFRRRGYNIESLAVGHTHQSGISRMTVVVGIDEIGAPLVMANLYKLAEVVRVDDITAVPSVHRELVMAKITAAPGTRETLDRLLESLGARMLESGPESVVVEATGTEESIDRLIEAIRPFGLLELTRTGKVAMTSGQALAPALTAAAEQTQQPQLWNQNHAADLPRNCS